MPIIAVPPSELFPFTADNLGYAICRPRRETGLQLQHRENIGVAPDRLEIVQTEFVMFMSVLPAWLGLDLVLLDDLSKVSRDIAASPQEIQ
jgi:hypothetical protein